MNSLPLFQFQIYSKCCWGLLRGNLYVPAPWSLTLAFFCSNKTPEGVFNRLLALSKQRNQVATLTLVINFMEQIPCISPDVWAESLSFLRFYLGTKGLWVSLLLASLWGAYLPLPFFLLSLTRHPFSVKTEFTFPNPESSSRISTDKPLKPNLAVSFAPMEKYALQNN